MDDDYIEDLIEDFDDEGASGVGGGASTDSSGRGARTRIPSPGHVLNKFFDTVNWVNIHGRPEPSPTQAPAPAPAPAPVQGPSSAPAPALDAAPSPTRAPSPGGWLRRMQRVQMWLLNENPQPTGTDANGDGHPAGHEYIGPLDLLIRWLAGRKFDNDRSDRAD